MNKYVCPGAHVAFRAPRKGLVQGTVTSVANNNAVIKVHDSAYYTRPCKDLTVVSYQEVE